jgi:hypothetical protein
LSKQNWVFDYAAPGHHKGLDAVALLERARGGDLQLHLPAVCLTEARHAIVNKCQPRTEANAIRDFLNRARWERTVTPDQDRATREVLSLFERQIQAEIEQLDDVLASLRMTPGLELFSLNQNMLERAIDLGRSKLWLQPFDQAILAAVLVRAEELLALGEIDLFFCEKDHDLQPWDKLSGAKQPLTSLYNKARLGLWRFQPEFTSDAQRMARFHSSRHAVNWI